MSELKLYRCNLCGNMFLVVADAEVTPICCGENMELLALYTVDAAYEKHVPVISVSRIPEVGKKVTVTIGEKEHPMTDSHFIERVVLKTCCGTYMKELHPGEKPQVEFLIGEAEEVAAAYAYCNIHGLWKQTECRGGSSGAEGKTGASAAGTSETKAAAAENPEDAEPEDCGEACSFGAAVVSEGSCDRC